MARADRPHPDDERGVHFVVGEPDAGADEELAPPDGRATRRRLRIELGIGALALLVVLLVVHGASGSHSVPRAGQTGRSGTVPDSTVPRGTLPTSGAPVPSGSKVDAPGSYNAHLRPTVATATPHPAYPTRIPRRRGTDPMACPGLHCTSSTALPTPVSDAIQATFPESTLQRSVTVRLRDAHRLLWYREVDVRVGTETLSVHVQAPARGDRSGSGYRDVDGGHETYVSGSLGPWHVEIAAVDLLGGRVGIGPLTTLARDPRLVAG